LKVPESSADIVLEVSSLGYKSKSIAVGNKNYIEIVLTENTAGLNDVVVVGYGTQKKTQFIGSVAQISGSDVTDAGAAPLLTQSLAGRLAGVTIIQNSGQPGASGGTIQIRGVGSFGAGINPLILVDGIQTNTFDNIDPSDIETITVLKDGSTAAIYGAQAANGVILVTTKIGKSDKLKISYSASIAVQKITATPKSVPSWEYATLLNEANAHTNPGSNAQPYSAAQIDSFKVKSSANYPNTDWLGAFFKKNALQQEHNISLSNGNKSSQYLLSLGYLSQDGIVSKNNFQRYNVRFNLVSNISKNLKLTTRISGYQALDKEPLSPAGQNSNMAGLISSIIRYPSIYPIYNSDGSWALGLENKGTPLSWLGSDSYYKDKYTTMEGNLRLDWNITQDLKVSGIAGYTESNERSTTFYASQQLTPLIYLGPATLNEGYVNNTYNTVQLLVNYHKKFGAHEIDFLGGHSYEHNYSESIGAGTNTFLTNNVIGLSQGNSATPSVSGSKSESALDSYFGRLDYNFDNKYLIQGTLRRDGSSRFGPAYKYGTFPSVAAGWRLGQEHFIKDHISWIDELKLKASYSILGNQNIGNYSYQSTLNQSNGYVIGGTFTNGVVLGSVNDPTLHWESTRTKDAGIEAGVFKGLISFSATYFDKYTYNIITTPGGSVSSVYGLTVGYQNSGSVNNHGWEFTLQHKNEIGAFSYNITANLSIIKNTVLDLGKGNNTKLNSGYVGNGTLFVGQPLNNYYGYVANGLYTDSADVKNWQATNNTKSVAPTAHPGDIRYTDVGGANGSPKDSLVTTADQRVLGSQIPKYSYGINFTFGYKNFDLNILLQGVADVSGYLNNYAGWAFYNQGTIQQWQANGRWTEANPNRNAVYPRLEIITNTGNNNTLTSSYWIINGSYLRLKSVQLGYIIPAKLIKRAGIDNLRFNFSAYNLYTWSHYRKGWDPEINTGGSYYPILGTYSLGVNVNF
jgi:TonB-linked SusC/RagA family outer membrane protein